MAKWERGEVGDSTKVSFQVKRKDHPALFAWLASLPYGTTSARIRDILDQAVKLASASRAAQTGKNASSKPPAPGPTPGKRAPAHQEKHAGASSSSVSQAQPLSEVAITEEAAKMILEMETLF